MSESLKIIEDNAFSECRNLKAVCLPLALEKLGWGCFSDSGLAEVVIPASVKHIEALAFPEVTVVSRPADYAPDGVLTVSAVRRMLGAREGQRVFSVPAGTRELDVLCFSKT